jgi:hypothetical protein
VGDFNGDGKLDLAVAIMGNPNSNGSVDVLLGNGDGTFQAGTSYVVGSRPNSIAVGDFNGDGKVDLAVANQSSDSVSVLAGNGDGTFQPAVNFGAGSFPYSVAVGDFNGDGKPDLAVASAGSNNVTILMNTTVFPKAATTTALASSVNPSAFGQFITLTATIISNRKGSTGTVTFLDGTNTLGTRTMNGGVATLSTGALAIGLHSISAVYGGDSNFTGSTSMPVMQVVNKARTGTRLASSPNPSMSGEAVTFTVTVTSTHGVPPDGETITFMAGKAVMGTGTLSGGSARLTTSTLRLGVTRISAVYGGDSNFTGSKSMPVMQMVEKAKE